MSTNLQVRTRQVWGTDTYTSDSDLVAVLMHGGWYLPSASVPPSLVELRVRRDFSGFPKSKRGAFYRRVWRT